jgi:hypothetical protein
MACKVIISVLTRSADVGVETMNGRQELTKGSKRERSRFYRTEHIMYDFDCEHRNENEQSRQDLSALLEVWWVVFFPEGA